MAEQKSILVVDDTEDILGLCTHLLSGAGYDVRTATNGYEALVALEERRADLILMDIMMPTMDGLTAVETIKGDPKTRDIPVIFMSAGQNLQTLAPRVIRLSSAIVVKPFDMAALLETVKRLAPMAKPG